MLRVGNSRKRYEALIFVRFRGHQAPEDYGCTEFYGLA